MQIFVFYHIGQISIATVMKAGESIVDRYAFASVERFFFICHFIALSLIGV
jgi:hypothetical protein